MLNDVLRTMAGASGKGGGVAALALLGIESTIEEVRLESGRTVYRVRTQTLDGAERLNATLRKLDEKGIDTLVMRVKG